MPQEFNILALIKGQERYIYVYDDASREGLINALRDQAADPRLNFSWFDAAVLTAKAQEQAATGRASLAGPRGRRLPEEDLA